MGAMKALTPYICVTVAIALFATGAPEAGATILSQIVLPHQGMLPKEIVHR